MDDASPRRHSPLSTRIPPFLILPTETLLNILEYLSPDPISFDDEAYGYPPFHNREHPILRIRQVCNRLRTIANELPFWYND